MKQIEQHYRSGRMRIIEAPVPRAGDGTALVATGISLISAGTEKQIVDLARSSLAGKAMARPDLVRQTLRKAKAEGVMPVIRKVFSKLDTPIPLGYSLAGQVVSAGADSGVQIGDRVTCAGAGIANHAEYNAVPKNLMARIPAGVTDEQASFVTVGAIALQGVRVTAPTLGERVVVMGLGLIGLLTVQLLKANGCRVIGFDPNPDRVRFALELGADVAVSADLAAATAGFTDGAGADAVIVTASTKSSDPVNQAAEISRVKGRVVIVGLVGMTLDRDPFYKRELDLRLSMSYGPGRYDPAYEIEGHDYPLPYVRWTEQRNMAAFLDLVAAGSVTPERLVTHRFPIAEAERAYALMDGDEPYLAILLTYPDAASPAHAVAMSAPRAATGAGLSFIGFGNYAKSVLMPAFVRTGALDLRTVVTATGISAHGNAEKHGFAVAATDPAAAIDDATTSAIVIATRHDSHAALATRALAAGKHVFVEKPLALDRHGVAAAIAATHASGATLTVGFNRRFAPMVVAAKAVLDAAGGPRVLTYRISAGAIPRESWVHAAEGGGRIAGEVCHFVDTLAALAGAPPIAVEGASPDTLDDSLAAVLRFADGSVGTILYASVGDPSIGKERIEAFAAGTHILIDDFSRLEITRGGKTRVTKATQDKGQNALVAAFMATVREAAPAPIDLATIEAVSLATLDLAGR